MVSIAGAAQHADPAVRKRILKLLKAEHERLEVVHNHIGQIELLEDYIENKRKNRKNQ
jgi:hypothetical protein